MRAWANLYPWDVDGDPAAADRIAGLGLTGVTLAAAYHAVRAVTLFHPQHRIVTRDAAVYYRADSSRWRAAPSGQRAGPTGQQAGRSRPPRLRPVVVRPAGSFERAATALRARGLAVTAWAVITHSDRLGAVVPSAAVRNAFEHLSAHDKTAGAADGAAAQWLLSVCFCSACRREYAAAGADPAIGYLCSARA